MAVDAHLVLPCLIFLLLALGGWVEVAAQPGDAELQIHLNVLSAKQPNTSGVLG